MRSSVHRSFATESHESQRFDRDDVMRSEATRPAVEWKPSPRLQCWLSKRSSYRLRHFAHLVERTQNTYLVAALYTLISFNTLTPMVAFLSFSAVPGEYYYRGILNVAPSVVASVHLGVSVFYGSRNLLLLILGFGAVKDSSIMAALSLDVLVWIGLCTCWVFVFHLEEWTEENTYLLSIAGLLSSLELNTFLLLNTRLNPLLKTKKKDGRCAVDATVPVETIERLIEETLVEEKYKNVLTEELKAVDLKNDGQIDKLQFFEFSNKATAWIQRWSTKQGGAKELSALSGKLQFSQLVERTASDYVGLMTEEATSEEIEADTSIDEEQSDGGIIAALLLSATQLFSGQTVRATAMMLAYIVMAFSLYSVNLIVGAAINLATDLADGDESVRSDFHRTLIYMVVAILLNISTYYTASSIGATLISNATARIQREIANKVLYGGSEFEKTFRPGSLTNNFNANLSKLESVWYQLWDGLVYPVCTLTAAVVFFCVLDVGYAMFALSAVPLVFCFNNLMEGGATLASEQYTSSSSKLVSRFQNMLGISKAAKVYESQDFLLDGFEKRVLQTTSDNYSSQFRGNLFGDVFNSVGTTLLLITNVVLLFSLSAGKIDAGEFFSLSSFVNGIIDPLERLGLLSGRVAYLSGAVFDIERLLQFDEGGGGNKSDGLEPKENAKLVTLKDRLTLEKVAFRYEDDQPLVVNAVSASIPAGTYTCIFGPSGCGKSTLLSLVEGFQRCTDGRICMDGVDIASISLSNLRRNLGVVFQDTYVLDGTIQDNIAFGYDKTIQGRGHTKHPRSLEAVVEAAKDAQIHDFILTLPNGYNTVIGLEADISLSGGQLQRVCGLARALVRQPALLVLDEATSALDTISEEIVIDTVVGLARDKGMSALSVSHRTSTAVDADMILVLSSDGEVDQCGTYNQLMEEEDGLFFQLVEAGGRRGERGDEG